MKNTLSRLTALFLLLGAGTSFAELGTFIQLNRTHAEKTVDEWKADIEQMKSVGIQRLIVQWSSEPPVVFFDYPVHREHYVEESYPVLEKLFEANQEFQLDIHLGLQNNPYFWTQIKGRDRVLRDFFLLRISRNERLQVALLERFDHEETWKGYYIPDEVDDYTWRHKLKRPAIRKYIHHLSERLHVNDPDRSIAISTFFRGRTSPTIVAENLLYITAGSHVDYLLLQDGVGVGDPPIDYLPIYYGAISDYWDKAEESPEWLAEVIPADESETSDPESEDVPPTDEPVEPEPPALPELWSVVETFEQTHKPDEPFRAVPGPVDRVALQLEEAEALFDTIIFFTFLDYMSPDLGPEAAALFEQLNEKANP